MDIQTQLDLYRWLADAATSTLTGEAVLQGFCERLDEAGIPLLRVALTFESLDPLFEARGFRWVRGAGPAVPETFARPDEPGVYPDDWVQSPFFALYQSTETRLRQRLETKRVDGEFSIFTELRQLGGTDYLAVKTSFSRAGAGAGALSSWTTDQPGGFTVAQIATLDALLPGLTMAMQAVAMSHAAEAVLETYLGRDASRRVLEGELERGVAATLDAVLWTSDLAGFTRLADTEEQPRVIDLLNAYAERTADAIEAAGGEILKFTGDGMLAVFDRATRPDAPADALRAATRALAETTLLSAERSALGLPTSHLRIALHAGTLFYGNVGSRTRLDFTVIGPAVNEASRLCDMCKSVDRSLVVSAAFHDAAPDLQPRLVGLGRYALRGVARPQRLYTLDEGD